MKFCRRRVRATKLAMFSVVASVLSPRVRILPCVSARATHLAFVRESFYPCRPPTVSSRSRWCLASEPSDGQSSFEPTWKYVPYDPNQKKKPSNSKPRYTQRRPSSIWTVPKTVTIPEDRLDITFVRSSGAGGQNVNKVNTKVELRFLVDEASWIPAEVRDRLKQQQSNRISKDGYMTLQSQEYRTQAQNCKAAVSKLKELLLQAWPRPKIRKQRKGISKAAKERNKEFKKRRSETKSNRKRVDW